MGTLAWSACCRQTIRGGREPPTADSLSRGVGWIEGPLAHREPRAARRPRAPSLKCLEAVGCSVGTLKDVDIRGRYTEACLKRSTALLEDAADGRLEVWFEGGMSGQREMRSNAIACSEQRSQHLPTGATLLQRGGNGGPIGALRPPSSGSPTGAPIKTLASLVIPPRLRHFVIPPSVP